MGSSAMCSHLLTRRIYDHDTFYLLLSELKEVFRLSIRPAAAPCPPKPCFAGQCPWTMIPKVGGTYETRATPRINAICFHKWPSVGAQCSRTFSELLRGGPPHVHKRLLVTSYTSYRSRRVISFTLVFEESLRHHFVKVIMIGIR